MPDYYIGDGYNDCADASDEVDAMLGKMTSGSYINLLKVFEEYFGSYVVLETTNSEYLEALA